MEQSKIDEIVECLSQIKEWIQDIDENSQGFSDICYLIIAKAEYIEYLLTDKNKETIQ